jgi:hypothetical protein
MVVISLFDPKGAAPTGGAGCPQQMVEIKSSGSGIRYRSAERPLTRPVRRGCPVTGHRRVPKIVVPRWHASTMTDQQIPATISYRMPAARADPAPVADERQALTESLDYYRETFELKCAGLDATRLSERSVPPSTLSLHGLLRHLTGCEQWWFRMQFAGEDVPILYYSDDDPEQDFDDLGGDVDEAFALWRAECARSREIVAAGSLDQTGVRKATGEPFTLRWLMLRAIGEYARHCGHADLLRELIDGEVGE